MPEKKKKSTKKTTVKKTVKKKDSLEEEIISVFTESVDVFSKSFVPLIIGVIIALISMIFIITIPPMIFGIFYMASMAVKGEKIEIRDIFKGFDYLVESYLIFIISTILIGIGFIFFIIPGMALIVLLQYSISIVILEKKGAIDALQGSFNIARENIIFSIILFIAISMINSIGSTFGFGALLTIPFSAIVTTIAVKNLEKL